MIKITTDTGREMLRSVLPIYNDDEYSLAIFEANGKVMDEVRTVVKQTRNQMFPQMATWSLGWWEEKLGITDMEKRPHQERIHRVLFELNKYFTITRHQMEIIVNNYVELKSAKVEEVDEEYAFRVVIPAGHKSGVGLRAAVEESKPAHLLAIFEQAISAGAIIITDDTYHYPVFYKTCGEFSGEKEAGLIDGGEVSVANDTYHYFVEYPVSVRESLLLEGAEFSAADNTYTYPKTFPVCGDMDPLDKRVSSTESRTEVDTGIYNFGIHHLVCGEFYAEGES
ncbi:putative phage tail protein [Sporosarcina sp. FSL K6-1508]|uniref:putative phage tail protein n=1 Tax=Sporosarcina sp. FSL K6-1508 TaxID=2921553 RepID=UPI0030F534E8